VNVKTDVKFLWLFSVCLLTGLLTLTTDFSPLNILGSMLCLYFLGLLWTSHPLKKFKIQRYGVQPVTHTLTAFIHLSPIIRSHDQVIHFYYAYLDEKDALSLNFVDFLSRLTKEMHHRKIRFIVDLRFDIFICEEAYQAFLAFMNDHPEGRDLFVFRLAYQHACQFNHKLYDLKQMGIFFHVYGLTVQQLGGFLKSSLSQCFYFYEMQQHHLLNMIQSDELQQAYYEISDLNAPYLILSDVLCKEDIPYLPSCVAYVYANGFMKPLQLAA